MLRHAVLLSLLLAGVVLAGRGAEPAPPLPAIVAHRGLARYAPENTLGNFRACLELRLGIELDVRRAKDGTLVCLHDTTLDRTTTGRGKVGDFTVAELKKLDAGSWFGPAFRGERIPTMDEVFALLASYPRVPILMAIDLKEENTEADVARLADKHGVLDRLVFIGLSIGSAEVRQRLHQATAKARVARLADAKTIAEATADPEANWIYVRHLPSRDEVARSHAAGKRVFLSGPLVAGPVPATWQQAAELGVDAILTDYPLGLRDVLQPRPTAK